MAENIEISTDVDAVAPSNLREEALAAATNYGISEGPRAEAGRQRGQIKATIYLADQVAELTKVLRNKQ